MNRLTIGEFARRSRLPVSTLRYYHELGILDPVEVDPRSNYRYYSHAQVAVAVRIAEFRSVGLTPDQIRAILAADGPETTLTQIRAELVADLAHQQQRLDRFDRLVATEQPDTTLEAPLLTNTVLAWAASRPVTATSDRLIETIRRGFATLRRESNIDGLLAATFPLDLTEDAVDVELHIESSDAPENQSTVPALKVLHRGPHRTLWIAYDQLLDHAELHHHHPSGHVTERYLPPNGQRPQTEVLLHLIESDQQHDRD